MLRTALVARWLRERGARGRGRRRREHVRPPWRGPASGRARTSTPCRTAGASTGPSASSRRSRRPSARASPLAVVAFRDEERGYGGSLAARRGRRPAATPTSSCTSSRARCSSALGEPLGIVTAIAGQARGEVVFEGRADHAGTTPMDARDDALVEAASFVLRVRDAAGPGTVATVGRVEVEPGAANVVPGPRDAVGRRPCRDGRALDALVAAIGFVPACAHRARSR